MQLIYLFMRSRQGYETLLLLGLQLDNIRCCGVNLVLVEFGVDLFH